MIAKIPIVVLLSIMFAASVQAGVLCGIDSGKTDYSVVNDSGPEQSLEIPVLLSHSDDQGMGGSGGASSVSFSGTVAVLKAEFILDPPGAGERIALFGNHLPDQPHLDCPLRPS